MSQLVQSYGMNIYTFFFSFFFQLNHSAHSEFVYLQIIMAFVLFVHTDFSVGHVTADLVID